MVQAPTAKLELLKLMLVLPAEAVTEPPQPLTTLGVAATTRLVGSVSVKLPLIATVFGLLIPNVIVLGAFTATVVGLKLLVIEGGCKTMMLAVTVCASTVASAEPFPPTPPALNVAVAVGTGLPSVSGCACGMVPKIALLNVIGNPTISSRLPASVAPLP